MRFGTEVQWRVYRQISPQEHQFIIEGFDFIYVLMLVLLLSLLPICLLGNSLSTWMFLNTLQLIAHMPLLNTLMPANLHLFLAKYLDFVRLSPANLF